MEFIIDFFRNIDGWIYYTMLVVNTILIFAIIGYLGEKSNEQLMKIGMNTQTPDFKNGAMNLTPTHASPSVSVASIPKVAATPVGTGQNANVAVPISKPSPLTTTNQVNTVQQNINNQQAPSTTTNTNVIPTINTQSVVGPQNNGVSTNEKAPSVLIINSSDVNKGAK